MQLLSRWSDIVVRRPRLVLAVVLGGVIASAGWGVGVFDRLSEGGHSDPHSEAARVNEVLEQRFERERVDVIAIYTAPRGRSLEDIRGLVLRRLRSVDKDVLASPIVSWWTAPDPVVRRQMVSPERRSALAIVATKGTEDQQLREFADLEQQLRVPGVKTQITGYSAIANAYNTVAAEDLREAETITFPITLALLVLIFGGLIAASIPVVVGGLAIAGTLGILRVLAELTEVSQLAMNITTMLGLGLAIDYGLLIVGRFREELAAAPGTREAAKRTVVTAGRTVILSALLLIVALSGLFLFPQPYLRSLGFGAVSAIAIAAIVSLSIVPAALALLGARINALSWRRDAAARAEARGRRIWGGLADRVMRRPLPIAITVTAILLLLASPLLHAGLADTDHTGLPRGHEARLAFQQLVDEFPGTGDGAALMLTGRGGRPPAPAAVAALTRRVERVEGVLDVAPLGRRGARVLLQARLAGGDRTASARRTVDVLRELAAPTGTTLAVGGETALANEGAEAIADRLPLMILVMVIATLVVSVLAFGSVVLAVKAVVMSALSLTATFGILTWLFMDGHGTGLLDVTAGPLVPAMVVLIIAVVFGLSTDYELFLLSRMSEARAQGLSTDAALRAGIASTGRIITAAALLLSVVIGAFALSDLAIMRFLAVGLVIGLILDATIVRMLLVPSIVKLMGEANWWAPRMLARRRPAPAGKG